MVRIVTAVEQPRAKTWQECLAEQDGVITRKQARQGGLTEEQWQWRLDTGRWQRVLLGVAVAHSGPVTDRQRAWAAVAYAGEGAALTGDAALAELRMKIPFPAVVHVLTTREVARQRYVSPAQGEDEEPPGLVVPHRARRLDEWVHPVRRPRVVRPAPALLHAAAFATTGRAAEWRVAAGVQQQLVRVSDLRAALLEMPRLERRALVRGVLDDVELGAHAQSELDFLSFLRRHRLPRPDRLQRPVRTGKIRYLDAWWEKQRVAAEMDGAHHRLVGQWDDDALRGNDVMLVERHDRILLLRFTAGNLRHDEHRVAEQLRRALL
jgi:very-short-patch-repair endonuclease